MKKLFIAIVLVCAAFVAKAEDYKAFRVDVGLGYAKPSGGGGVLFAIEPKYAITPNIAAGLRGEIAGMAKVKWTENAAGQFIDSGDTELKFNSSFLVTGDYYFMTKKFRPFGGLGLGAYSLSGASVSVNTGGTNADLDLGSKTNFGFMIRAGFDVSHIRLAVEYNFAGKDDLDKSYNYLGIKFSAYIGGGIKK